MGIKFSNAPVEPSMKEVLESIASFQEKDGTDPELRLDEETLTALRFSGFRIVRTCSLCAEPEGSTIPACPNVATHTVRETRGRWLRGMSPLYLCDEHAHGLKTRAKKRCR